MKDIILLVALFSPIWTVLVIDSIWKKVKTKEVK